MYTCMYVYPDVCMHACMYASTQNVCLCLCSYIYTKICTHTFDAHGACTVCKDRQMSHLVWHSVSWR